MVLSKTFRLTAALLGALAISTPALASGDGHGPKIERQDWTFGGLFGTFDKAQLQRGFRVYKEVCSACHGLSIPMRTLSQSGGPGFTEDQVKTLAAEYKVKDGPNDAGDMFERAGRPSDKFPQPFANKNAAASALQVAPPDFAVLAKARTYSRGFPLFLLDPLLTYQEHGVDYIYGLLNGYSKDDDPNWNDVFPGNKIAMAKPISDGAVEYTDGSPKTVQQYAKDVSAFLMWAAEPALEQRKAMGLKVIIFLMVFASLLYLTKKRIWANVEH